MSEVSWESWAKILEIKVATLHLINDTENNLINKKLMQA